MRGKFVLCAAVLLVLFGGIGTARADDSGLPPELQGLGLYDDLLPIGAGNSSSAKKRTRQQTVIPFIRSSLPKAIADTALYNVEHPEQVFCYHIARKPKDFTGYTLNNFAVVDFCGELDMGATTTTYEALFTQSPNIITATAACAIEPKVMLRFVRGVDYTDVLLSSPCPSFTLFYAGRYTAFNIKQAVIDDVISQFDKTRDTFNSPALLKKTVANGVADTDKEAEEYEKKQKENAPIMNWKNDQSSPQNAEIDENSQSSDAQPKAKKGWGNIKLRM